MEEFVLPVDPSIWNVIKFFALSLVVTPILEFLLQSLIASRMTHAVRKGKHLQMFDSRMGIFALHSRYAGSHCNRLWLVCCAVFILGMQLLLEYSFSSAEIETFESVRVWEGPSHQARYFAANNTVIQDEPTRFLDDVARACVNAPRAFNRSEHEIPRYPEVIAKFTYNTSFRIRSPYMRADTEDVACGVSSEEQNAYVMIPSIISNNGYEGLNSECSVDPFHTFPFWFDRLLNETFRITGSFDFEGVVFSVFVGKHSVCLHGGEPKAGICAISNGTHIVIGKPSIFQPPDILRCIHMFISGEGMQQLHEAGRKIRFLAYIIETKVLNPDRTNTAEQLVLRTQLEHTVQVALAVASEETVVGIQEAATSRSILLPEKRNVTTVSVLAIVPATMLLATALVLVAYDVLVRMSVAKMEGKEGEFFRGAFSHSRVDLSRDWVRDRVAADLTRAGLGTCTTEDIRVKLVGRGETSRIQVLPEGMVFDDMYD